MAQIVTLTMNPALDKSTSTHHVVVEEKLRCHALRLDAGGGGINVARAIHQLGGEALPLYMAGGMNGQVLQRLLQEQQIEQMPIAIAGETRESFTVFEESTTRQYRFNLPGPELSEAEWQSALDTLATLTPPPEYVVASGSLPPGAPANFYVRLAERIAAWSPRLIVDTSGLPLQTLVDECAPVYMIKPNHGELGVLIGRQLVDDDDILRAARELLTRCRIEILLVSLGAGGILLITNNQTTFVRAPTVPIRSKIGVGDSTVAGITLGLTRGFSLLEAVRFGVAAGAAAVMSEGTGLCRREDAERLFAQIQREECVVGLMPQFHLPQLHLPFFNLPPVTINNLFWAIFFAYLIVSAIYIISENRPPAVTMAWILSFLALPIVGVLIYIFFGRTVQFFNRRIRLLEQTTDSELLRRLRPLVARQTRLTNTIRTDPNRQDAQRRLIEMERRSGLSILTAGDQVDILQDAKDKYARLEADIEAAKDSIHMEYFIWQVDPYMQKFGDLLIRKAQAGVEVRVLFDALGSHFLLWKNRGYLNRLRAGGVKMYPYLNFLGLWRLHTINYRNHRKIAVIDGMIGYTGGMNMGEEHLKGAPPYKAWRDTHLRITGDTVSILQGIFTTSWYNTTKEELTDPRYFPINDETPDNPIPIQIVLSGPDSQWHAIQQQYFLMILSAQDHVYIQSPFFIPNSSISEAIRVAALSGIDVKLMFAPRDTGTPIANWAANTYFLEMVEARAKVYLYTPAYLHGKTLSVDSSVCSIGTANMDIRSFNINYEMNAILYDATKTLELEEAFHKDLESCIHFDAKAYRAQSRLLRFRDSLARLLSPLL